MPGVESDLFRTEWDYDMRLFNKYPNQLTSDVDFFEKNRDSICSKITHVIDCECYMSRATWRLREVSIFDICIRSVKTYYLCYDDDEIPRSHTVMYQINRIHGLPIVNTKLNDNYYKESELSSLLLEKIPYNALVAYKGGNIESSLLRSLFRKSINLELLGCEKYDVLKDKYGLLSKCCNQHINTSYHCSRYEVVVFYFFINSVLFERDCRQLYYSL